LRKVDAGSSAYLRSRSRSSTVEDAASDAVYDVRGREAQPASMNNMVGMANGSIANRRKEPKTIT
jgi:hypothetical protein